MFESISKLIASIKDQINRGQKRSIKAKKNIVASFFIKGVSILIGFYLVPLTIGYVEKEQYGIWLTLSSVVGWFAFFDIGLGHGLRNKLSEALAVKDMDKAKTLVSSTYALLSIIIILLLAGFFVLQSLVDWQVILNTTVISSEELRLVALATFSFFCINFLLKLIYSIFKADQQPAKQNLFNLMSNMIALLVIVILTKTTEGSLFNLAFTLGLAPFFVLVLVSFFMFRGKYKAIAPALSCVRLSQFKELGGLGFRFFIVQVSSIIIFSTDNMIIAQILGPAEVPAYAIAHKYFGLISALFAIVTTPFWSAYTEAYVKKDFDWIVSVNKKLIKVWFGLVAISFLLLAVSSRFYAFWVPEVEVPFLLSAMMCAYVNILTWGGIFVAFINGVGKIQIQLLVGLVAIIVNIPLSYFFAKNLDLGAAGVILATIISIAYGPILAPIQFKKIIKGTATGLWNR